MPRVFHFDLYVKDAQRAGKFYTEAFDWKIEKWDGPMDYWLISTGPEDEPGIDGGFGIGDNSNKSGELTLNVTDVKAACTKAKAAGGKLLQEAHEVPGIGLLAVVEDTEGNSFGLMQLISD